MLFKRLLVSSSILFQQFVTEGRLVLELRVAYCFFMGLIYTAFRKKPSAMHNFMQAHRSTRYASVKAHICERHIKNNLKYCGIDRDLSACEKDKIDGYIKNRVIVLKNPVSELETGVVLIKFTPVLELLPRALDMNKLLSEYTLIIEPSWSGLCQPEILQFCKFKHAIHVMAPEESDHAFVSMLNSNLVPTTLGPGDWVDANTLQVSPQREAEYDLVMNSNWASWKRHYVLFRSLSKMPNNTRVALIGFPYKGEARTRIEALAEYYGVSEQITIFERIDYSQVISVIQQSKVGVLMSLKEGANKSISECILYGVPVVILDTHVGGARGKITEQTGRFSTEKELHNNLSEMIDISHSLNTKNWALENISSKVSTGVLNQELKEYSRLYGLEWSVDIVEKRNSPELEYVSADGAGFKSMETYRI